MGKLLEGKVAVVTGGASGIGRAVSLRFASEGARVVVADVRRDPREGGTATDLVIQQLGIESRFVGCDVTKAADVETVMTAAEELGGVDVLVNNAGIFRSQNFLDVTKTDYDLMMDVNVKAVFFASQAAARRMVGKGSGGIINISSVAGLQGQATRSLYCMSKGAVRLLTYALAQELGPKGIRVNVLHPGLVDTTMTTIDVQVIGFEEGDATIAKVPLGRVAQPEDIANGALYLASDLSAYVNGASLVVDGGLFCA
jgi:NAD(P)-dependent dehydrogenase (short-subunit alcohol dehydrogenase family)